MRITEIGDALLADKKIHIVDSIASAHIYRADASRSAPCGFADSGIQAPLTEGDPRKSCRRMGSPKLVL